MICALNCNPSIDKTVSVEKFSLTATNRADIERTDLGGKGINLAYVASEIGGKGACIGFLPGKDRDFIEKRLSPKVEYSFVVTDTNARVNLKINDRSDNSMIEVNEKGEKVSEENIRELEKLISEYAMKSDCFVFAGSTPPGIDNGFYYNCILTVKKANPLCKIIVDADGDRLIKAINGSPFLIKPNIHEFENTFSYKYTDDRSLVRKCREIIFEYGVEIVCVSMGNKGSLIVSKDKAVRGSCVDVTPKGLQGAGDSMVAGIAYAVSLDKSFEEVLHYGAAASAGTIMREGTLLCTKSDFDELLKKEFRYEFID